MDLDDLLDECLNENNNDDDLLNSILEDENKLPTEYENALKCFPEKDRYDIYIKINKDIEKLNNYPIKLSYRYYKGIKGINLKYIVENSIKEEFENAFNFQKYNDIKKDIDLKNIIEELKPEIKKMVIEKIISVGDFDKNKYPRCNKIIS